VTADLAPPTAGASEVPQQARRRRTFAIISHPDAGKSTLTEALALHAQVISEAGAVHGKGNRKATVSDWLDMEKTRGISITSTALQFEYRDTVLNLLDTPGHADFSEDTYRVLAVVDVAVMLVDAARGLEPQTLKLFEVCRHSSTPVITVINKWDRPGRSALELLDEIQERIGLKPTPLTWPVGSAGDFRGVLNRADGTFSKFTRTPGGRTKAGEDVLSPTDADRDQGAEWAASLEEHELLELDGAGHDQDEFLAARTTPTLFTSAVLNFGVRHVLDTLVELAPAPKARPTTAGGVREVTDDFSAIVFKMQAGMDAAHRDRLAYARICSGRFERGMLVTHSGTGRTFATKPISLDVDFEASLGESDDAYERLLDDILDGDQRRFARQDTVEEAWRVVERLIGSSIPVYPYAPGTNGPNEASRLLSSGLHWYDPVLRPTATA